LDQYPKSEINAQVSGIVASYEPTTVLTHHWGDVNFDHRVVFDAVIVACRPHRLNEKRVKNILSMEILSSSDWNGLVGEGGYNPNLFVSVSLEAVNSKVKAFEKYSTEQCVEPHPRSSDGIRNLAKYRGNSMNLFFAESFVQIRTVL
jgi:LmbE family N-acetylglucosaminyl deacetylase